MAKKAKKQNKKAPAEELQENILPQNILPVGERVEENKNIYISQAVYKEIHKFTKNKTTNESGGILVGTIVEEFGKTNIVISGFVEAKFCEATPTTLKFTHETWEFAHKEIAKKHKGKKIVGWIHTHPDFGIFLSEYDKFIHQNFFSETYQIAYVVDPIQNIEGFYFWINGNIEKCKGFYIYEKTGTRITIDTDKDGSSEEKTTIPLFSLQNALILILAVIVVFLIFSNISTNNQLEELEKKQETLVSQQVTLANSANQALANMQQMITAQSVEIQELQDILKEASIIDKPETSTEPEDDAVTGNVTENTEEGNADHTDDNSLEDTNNTETTEPLSFESTEPTDEESTDTTEGSTATNE